MQLTLHMPVYVWAIVAILALAWLKVLLPERFFRRSAKETPSPYLELKHDFGPAAPVAKAAAPAQPGKWTLEVMRELHPTRLEDLISSFWQVRACKVEIEGTDLMVYRPATGRVFAIARCQPAGADKTGVESVRALWELVQQRQAPLGLFYGLSGFAPEAVAFAKDKPLKLLMGSDLLTEIGHLRPDTQRALLARVTTQEQTALAA